MGSNGVEGDYGNIAMSAMDLELLAELDLSNRHGALHSLELIAASAGRTTQSTLDVYFDRFKHEEAYGRVGLLAHTEEGEQIFFIFSGICDAVSFVVDIPPNLTKSEWSVLGDDFLS